MSNVHWYFMSRIIPRIVIRLNSAYKKNNCTKTRQFEVFLGENHIDKGYGSQIKNYFLVSHENGRTIKRNICILSNHNILSLHYYQISCETVSVLNTKGMRINCDSFWLIFCYLLFYFFPLSLSYFSFFFASYSFILIWKLLIFTSAFIDYQIYPWYDHNFYK